MKNYDDIINHQSESTNILMPIMTGGHTFPAVLTGYEEELRHRKM